MLSCTITVYLPIYSTWAGEGVLGVTSLEVACSQPSIQALAGPSSITVKKPAHGHHGELKGGHWQAMVLPVSS